MIFRHSGIMEHADLISEMAAFEHMSTQERLLLARRRRMQQLKVWSQREKEWLRQLKNSRTLEKVQNRNPQKRNVTFSNNVMLLEAASRNDIDEGREFLFSNLTLVSLGGLLTNRKIGRKV